jgi:hypothetical protein
MGGNRHQGLTRNHKASNRVEAEALLEGELEGLMNFEDTSIPLPQKPLLRSKLDSQPQKVDVKADFVHEKAVQQTQESQNIKNQMITQAELLCLDLELEAKERVAGLSKEAEALQAEIAASKDKQAIECKNAREAASSMVEEASRQAEMILKRGQIDYEDHLARAKELAQNVKEEAQAHAARVRQEARALFKQSESEYNESVRQARELTYALKQKSDEYSQGSRSKAEMLVIESQKQRDALLRSAQAEADEIKQEAISEAQKIRANGQLQLREVQTQRQTEIELGRKKSEELISSAQEQVCLLKSEAETLYEMTLEEARRNADLIRKEVEGLKEICLNQLETRFKKVRHQCTKLIHDSKSEAAKIRADAESEKNSLYQELEEALHNEKLRAGVEINEWKVQQMMLLSEMRKVTNRRLFLKIEGAIAEEIEKLKGIKIDDDTKDELISLVIGALESTLADQKRDSQVPQLIGPKSLKRKSGLLSGIFSAAVSMLAVFLGKG